MKKITPVISMLLVCCLLLSGCGSTVAASTAAAAVDSAADTVSAAIASTVESAVASEAETTEVASDPEAAVVTSAIDETDAVSAEEAAEAETEDEVEDKTVSGAEIVADIRTVQAFTDEPVAEEDITAIVTAGINAPSAMNGQPWHFTVVTNAETLEALGSATSFGGGMPAGAKPPAAAASDDTATDAAPAAPATTTATAAKAAIGDSPLVIVVSCSSGSELDAGLATQNMSAEAQLLGYGTKILTSPKLSLNSDEYKTLLDVPEGMSVVCVLLVGVAAEAAEEADAADAVDAVSSATTRNPAEEVVTYLN